MAAAKIKASALLRKYGKGWSWHFPIDDSVWIRSKLTGRIKRWSGIIYDLPQAK